MKELMSVFIALQIIFQSKSEIVLKQSYFVFLAGCGGIRKYKIRIRAVKKTTVE